MAESFAPRRPEPVFARLAIIGIGLIGSSIARAAKELNLAGTIVLADRDEAVRKRAQELGLGDAVAETAAEAAVDADHIILCVPVGACGHHVGGRRRISPCVLTDPSTIHRNGISASTLATTMGQFGLLAIPVFVVTQLLSGATTPMESMPTWLQWTMRTLSPTPHFVTFSQGVLYRGAGFDVVWPEIAKIITIGAAYFGFALARFRKVIFA